MTVFFPKNHDWQGMGEQGEIEVGRYTAQKDSFPQFHIFDRNHSFLPIWSHLPKKSLMENFIFLCNVVFRTMAIVWIPMINFQCFKEYDVCTLSLFLTE